MYAHQHLEENTKDNCTVKFSTLKICITSI